MDIEKAKESIEISLVTTIKNDCVILSKQEIETVLAELDKKDKIIDEIVSEVSCKLTILNKEIQKYVKQEAEKGEYTNLDEIIKQYFKKKVEERSC